MGLLIFLAILVLSVVAVPIQRNQESEVEKLVTVVPETKTNLIKTDSIKRILKKHFTTKTSVVKDSTKKFHEKNATTEGSIRKNRRQKAFFLNNLNSVFEYPTVDQNYQESNRQQFQESKVYYIKLPPTPYVFIPGLGYISQPPTYSFPSKPRPTKYNHNKVPLVKVPIDFVSNGKPTSVYSYSDPNSSTKQSTTITLDKGPYVFNGSPVSFYLLDSNGKPLPRRTFKYADYFSSQKNLY